jgi:hypothetical protein
MIDQSQVWLKYRVSNQNGEFDALGLRIAPQFSGVEDFGAGYYGLNLFQEKLNYNKDSQTVGLTITNTCKPLYDFCMKKFNNDPACSSLCTEEQTGDYEIVTSSNNKFIGKAPSQYKVLAQCDVSMMSNGIPATESYIGFKYPFPQSSALELEKNPYVGTITGWYATGWGYVSQIDTNDILQTSFYQECVKDPINFGVSKMSGHETNHNFFMHAFPDIYGQFPVFEEGIVNYINFLSDKSQLFLCFDNGYKYSETDTLKPYKPNDTFSGQCFWQKLEEEYGHDVFKKITQKLDSTRYIAPTIGRRPPKSLFQNIINPIIGSTALQKRAEKWFGYIENQ